MPFTYRTPISIRRTARRLGTRDSSHESASAPIAVLSEAGFVLAAALAFAFGTNLLLLLLQIGDR
jgi:hypothetical protein